MKVFATNPVVKWSNTAGESEFIRLDVIVVEYTTPDDAATKIYPFTEDELLDIIAMESCLNVTKIVYICGRLYAMCGNSHVPVMNYFTHEIMCGKIEKREACAN